MHRIFAGRTSADGANNSFSGGTILFQGRRWDNEGSANKSRVSTTITLLDAWKELEKITFQITWLYESGGTIGSPTFSNFNWPDVVLMQAAPNQTYTPAPLNGNYITTGQQIQDIVNFARNYMTGPDAVQIQLGMLGNTPWFYAQHIATGTRCARRNARNA